MQELIKITKSVDNKNIVNARELHQGLESKKKFADWVKNKILNNPFFVEDEDYCLLPRLVKQTEGRGGHNKVDYAITLECAKRVAMAEQTDKGEEVRTYFLDCEKRLQTKEQFQVPQTFLQAMELATKSLKQIEEQKVELNQANKTIETKDEEIDTLIENFILGLTLKQAFNQFNGVSQRGNIYKLEQEGFIRPVSRWKTIDGVNILETGYEATGKSKGWFTTDVKESSTPKYRKYNDSMYFVKRFDLYLTQLGMKKLYNRYKLGKFTMVKSWDGIYGYKPE